MRSDEAIDAGRVSKRAAISRFHIPWAVNRICNRHFLLDPSLSFYLGWTLMPVGFTSGRSD